jgi:hypothetical protein
MLANVYLVDAVGNFVYYDSAGSLLDHTAYPVGTPTALLVVDDGPTQQFATLSNISTRVEVGINDNVLIAGFIIQGSQAKKVLIRALGPTLTQFGTSGVLANPQLELHDSNGTIATNDDWQTTEIGGVIIEDQAVAIPTRGLAPLSQSESAILATL